MYSEVIIIIEFICDGNFRFQISDFRFKNKRTMGIIPDLRFQISDSRIKDKSTTFPYPGGVKYL
jgi:hypothetical protein